MFEGFKPASLNQAKQFYSNGHNRFQGQTLGLLAYLSQAIKILSLSAVESRVDNALNF
jgi:hypothetical protein